MSRVAASAGVLSVVVTLALAFAACSHDEGDSVSDSVWGAVWQAGGDSRSIRILGSRTVGRESSVWYAEIPDPRSLWWEACVDRATDQVLPEYCEFRIEPTDGQAVSTACSGLQEKGFTGEVGVKLPEEIHVSGPTRGLWEGRVEWRLSCDGCRTCGSLNHQNFDPLEKVDPRAVHYPLMNELIWPALEALGIGDSHIGATQPHKGKGRSFDRMRCIAFLGHSTEIVQDPHFRYLILIARAALGDHAWRSEALESACPELREAAAVSIGLDSSIEDRVASLVAVMIEGPTYGVRRAAFSQLSALDIAAIDSEGEFGQETGQSALDDLARSLPMDSRFAREWLPIACVLGLHGRVEGLTWFLAAIRVRGLESSWELWDSMKYFVSESPSAGDTWRCKREWLFSHPEATSFRWDQDLRMFIPR